MPLCVECRQSCTYDPDAEKQRCRFCKEGTIKALGTARKRERREATERDDQRDRQRMLTDMKIKRQAQRDKDAKARGVVYKR